MSGAPSGFRAFGPDPQTLDLSQGPAADGLVVLHGDNASGKSSAIAAMELFFQAWAQWLHSTTGDGDSVAMAFDTPHTPSRLVLQTRDWHRAELTAPVVLQAELSGIQATVAKVILTPAGGECRVGVSMSGASAADRHDLLERLTPTPQQGLPARPFVIIDALRRFRGDTDQDWQRQVQRPSRLAERLLHRLYALGQSLDVHERERWRQLRAHLDRFDSLKGLVPGFHGTPGANRGETLTFERPGELIVKFDELSAGEQQIVVVLAQIVVAGSPIVAIEEPELNLSPAWQETLRDLLVGLVDAGVVGQLLIESHTDVFDSAPDVLQFHRGDAGLPQIVRRPVAPELDAELKDAAVDKGAAPGRLHPSGWIKLPETMRESLKPHADRDIWFFRHGSMWGAWPEAELEEALRLGDGGDGHGGGE